MLYVGVCFAKASLNESFMEDFIALNITGGASCGPKGAMAPLGFANSTRNEQQ